MAIKNSNNFEYHKKQKKYCISKLGPKWLKNVYFCPKSPNFELFDINGMYSFGNLGRFFKQPYALLRRVAPKNKNKYF
jgi:hypothetical protein